MSNQIQKPLLNGAHAPNLTFAAIGECMVELAPLDVARDFRMGFAGDTFNTSWYLKALQPNWITRYVTRVGNDPVSEDMLAMMQSAGIDTSHIHRSERSVGLYLISLDNGERSFTYWRDNSAARQLADDVDLLAAAIDDTDVVYVSGITLAILSPERRADLLNAMRTARENGKTVAFDSNLRPRLWADTATMCKAVMDAAACSDMVLPSYDDEAEFFGDDNIDATLARYADAGATTIIAKNGPGPVEYLHGGSKGVFVPEPMSQVVDTTSAGDSFNAGLFAGLGRTGNLHEAIALASKVAGQVIGRKGALVTLDHSDL